MPGWRVVGAVRVFGHRDTETPEQLSLPLTQKGTPVELLRGRLFSHARNVFGAYGTPPCRPICHRDLADLWATAVHILL